MEVGIEKGSCAGCQLPVTSYQLPAACNLCLQQLGQAPAYTALAPLIVLAPVAGSVQRVLGHLAVLYRFDLMDRRDHLPAVPGLDLVEAGNTVRDIFHVPAFYFLTGHLLQTERDTGNPDAVGRIGAKRHGSCRPDDRERAIGGDAVDHADNPMLVRDRLHIGLDRGFPFAFVAGRDAEFQELLHGRIECWGDRKDLLPDHVHL